MGLIRITYCLCFIALHFVKSDESVEEDYRIKRQVNGIPLVYPYGGTFRLHIGFSTPVPNKDHISLAFAASFLYQYVQFQNITELSQYYFIKEVSREQRDIDTKAMRDERLDFYDSFANLLKAKGMNGYECVLRAICEAAQYPVEEEGLVGEIIHILLTPDYGKNPFEEQDPEWELLMSEYIDAATAGRQMFSCPSIYSKCPEGQGVLELISTLRDQ